MENNIVAPHIKFSDIIIWDFWNKEKAFEHFCADFLRIYYNLNICPVPSNIDNFPWIESWPFDIEWKKCGYQSKFWQDAFESWKWFYQTFEVVKEQIRKWTYELEKIFLFSKIDLSPRKKIHFDEAKQEFTNETWIEVETFLWSQFLWILRWDNKFINLIFKYFPTDNVKIKIYEDYSNETNVNQEDIEIIQEKVENGFEWEYSEKDINLAKHHQKWYTYKKLSYSTYPEIWEIYNNLENHIAEEIFPTLEYWDNFSSLTNFLQTCNDNLIRARALANNYKIELDYMIWTIDGLFINYWTEWKSCLYYETSNKIHFKDKRHE